jgi:HSP20 family protein
MAGEDEKKRKRAFDPFGRDDDVFSMGFGSEMDGMMERMREDMKRMMEGMSMNMDNDQIKRLSQDRNVRVYGYSMRMGPDGKPQIMEFGNVAPAKMEKGKKARAPSEEGARRGEESEKEPGEREPLVDIIQQKDKLTVIAELPGVAEKDIKINASGKNLEIRVDSGERKYSRKLELPRSVDPKKMQKKYNNGVLELSFS